MHTIKTLLLLAIATSLLQAAKKLSIPSGTIAYIRNGKEIRLIQADGSKDILLWTHPGATKELGINELAWRPDGKELAFSSSHEAAHSLYHADLFAIKPDSLILRKLTNPPGADKLKNYPKGTVSVTFRNNQYTFQQSEASSGSFIVYIAGADEPQQITLPPGSSKTVVFKSVADFGNKAQAIVAIWGKYRWSMPGTDVKKGQMIKAPDFLISGNGIELFGAFHPVWRSDGSQISYRTGACTVDRIPADPPVGEFYYEPMFAGKAPLGACSWDWGPAPNLVNQLIYTENSGEGSGIYQVTEGGKHPGTWLTNFSNIQYQVLEDLHWHPDGNHILYATRNLMRDASDIFSYNIKSKQTTQLTHLQNEYVRSFSCSPDGEWIVYEKSQSLDDYAPADLWVMKSDGTSSRLLVKDAHNPAWKK